MGLDMYLYRNNEEVAYWRKANAIHKWFSDHLANGDIENCKEYSVSKENLEKLCEDCLIVLYNNVKAADDRNTIANESIAKEILPVQSVFFFGPQEYGSYYLDALQYTADRIRELLATTDFEKDEITYLAWW